MQAVALIQINMRPVSAEQVECCCFPNPAQGNPQMHANLAGMSILRDRHLPAQGRLEMKELRASWPRYALRARDLDSSIERLELLGLLEVDRVCCCHFVVLTERGYRRIHSLFGLIESLLVWPRRIGRWLGQLRQPRGYAMRLRRRRDDRG
ncbi:MAG: hypothetical protein ACT4PZ_19150 [Panacagrimonas sp.]